MKQTFNEKVAKRLTPILLDRYVDGQKVVVTLLTCDDFGMQVVASIIGEENQQLTLVTLGIPWYFYNNRRNLRDYLNGYIDGNSASS